MGQTFTATGPPSVIQSVRFVWIYPAALGGLWLLSFGMDGTWLWLDQAVPSWDPADHHIGALNYWWTLRQMQGTSDWWNSFWTLSSKYPPLLYISTAPLIALLGRFPDAAVLVNGLYTLVLLVAVSQLGRHLFSPGVGLWAAGVSLLMPQLYGTRTEYYMDYPLTVLVALALWALTRWRDAKRGAAQWQWAIAFGLCLGFAFLAKQTALLFLAVPVLWLVASRLWQRQWSRLGQIAVSGSIAVLLLLPWATRNCFFQVSAAFSANTRSAAIEGDPSAATLAGWLFYWLRLPQMVSFPLLLLPLAGLLLAVAARRITLQEARSLGWLGLFLGGSYIIWSAIANKDVRYVMPWLPVLGILLAYGLTQLPRWLRWGTVGLAAGIMLVNLFGGSGLQQVVSPLTPGAAHGPYRGEPYPHAEIVDEIVRSQPYQVVNVGILPSTPEVNQHNLTYYGNRADFRVYARRAGKSQEHLQQDVSAFDWFISVTRPQLRYHDAKARRRQVKMVRLLRPEFRRQRRWILPDGSRLDLWRRRQLPVVVRSLEGVSTESVQLAELTVPPQVMPGQPTPVTYRWQGPWQALHDGVVILSWRHDGTLGWPHDHSIGLGRLHPLPIQGKQTVLAPTSLDPLQGVEVVEHTAMLPPPNLSPGRYQLVATYLNRVTGQTYDLQPSDQVLQVAAPANSDESAGAKAPMPEAPALTAVTQLQLLAQALPLGPDALEPVFDQVGRLSLYDPVQRYLQDAEVSLSYRLTQDPHLDWLYGLVLARVLQRDGPGAIAALEQVTQLDGQNPYAHGYLGFVHLYALHPIAAERSLQTAVALAPDSTELRSLHAVAFLLRGNLWGAWREGRTVLNSQHVD
ncbi:MAG: phospholipid carrier-dependent glycosyltransferase [Elainellaceae cyanobacterium]